MNMVSPHKAPNMSLITFTSIDFKAIDLDQDDSVVISVEITSFIVRKTLIDQGSLADILFWNIFKQLGISNLELFPHDNPLFGFVKERVGTKGHIWLYTKLCHKGPQ